MKKGCLHWTVSELGQIKISLLVGFFSDLLDRSDNDSYLDIYGGNITLSIRKSCWFTKLPGTGEIGHAKNNTGLYGKFMF